MSWDKNTINGSDVIFAASLLEAVGTPYKLTKIADASANGMNDTIDDRDSYPLYRLEFRDRVALDRIERTYDCDGDDVIKTYVFLLANEPKSWESEVYLDDANTGEMIQDVAVSGDIKYRAEDYPPHM